MKWSVSLSLVRSCDMGGVELKSELIKNVETGEEFVGRIMSLSFY